jgi:hypothetical protein
MDTPHFDQVTLDRQLLAVMQRLDMRRLYPGLGDSVRVEAITEQAIGAAAIHLTAYVAEKRMERTTEETKEITRIIATVPADWWQAFRERWLPKSWLKRHPVQYREIKATTISNTTVHITVTNVCPHLPTGDSGPHVHFFQTADDKPSPFWKPEDNPGPYRAGGRKRSGEYPR